LFKLPVCLEGPANRHDRIPELVAASAHPLLPVT